MLEAIQDNLGLFTNPAMNVVNGLVLQKLALDAGYDSVKSFTKEIGISRTQSYREFRVTGVIRDRLLVLLRIHRNAQRLYSSEPDAPIRWLTAPNGRFYNLSPFMMALSGRGKTVYELQEELLGNT